jgi:hypothetical protein
LLLVGVSLVLLKLLFFFEGWAEHVAEVSRRCSWSLQGALQRCLHCRVVVVIGVGHLDGFMLVVDVAKANV